MSSLKVKKRISVKRNEATAKDRWERHTESNRKILERTKEFYTDTQKI